MGGAGDVGGEGGHGEGLETVSDWTPHVPVPTLGLVPGQESQQQLLRTAAVLVGAGMGKEVHQPVGHVRHALLGEPQFQKDRRVLFGNVVFCCLY